MSDHGHAAPKAASHAPAKSGGGGGGGAISFRDGVLLFLGAPAAILAFGWAGANWGIVLGVVAAVINLAFLALFIAWRVAWTFPIAIAAEGKGWRGWLGHKFLQFIVRSPALALATVCLLCLWWRAQYALWHPYRNQPLVGHFMDHVPIAIAIAVIAWVVMNIVSLILEWIWRALTGIGWPELHVHGAH